LESEDTRVSDPPVAIVIHDSVGAKEDACYNDQFDVPMADVALSVDEILQVEPVCGKLPDGQSDDDAVELNVAEGGAAARAAKASACAALPLARGLRCIWRLWLALVVLSILELLLLAGAAVLDLFWSPCREPLQTCRSLHVDACSGVSCPDASPLWAPVWPAAGLLILAPPLYLVLTGRSSGSPHIFGLVLVLALAVVGVGATVLAKFSTTGLEYVSRCPLPRAEGRCSAELCPAPPCRRENEFSPCVCGLVGEAELARALFLDAFPACQPYEWYASQMSVLEEIVLEYESFSCIVGPLTCASTAVGGVLLLVQLACCPLLFLGSCGLDRVLLVLFASDEELDRLVASGDPEAKDNAEAGLPAKPEAPEQEVAVGRKMRGSWAR